MKMLKKRWRWPIIVSVAIVTYIAILFLMQDFLLFFPDDFYTSPKEANLDAFEEMPITTPDGKEIMAWHYRGDISKPVILFFHGNAGQVARFAPIMKLYADEGYSLLMPEYRGFAKSQGSLSESAMYEDAEMWFDFLRQGLGYRKIIVFGYSLGTAPASRVAATRRPEGAVLMAPFYSLRREVADKRVLFATLVLKHDFESYKYIDEYIGPLLILHGAKDKLINSRHGQELFELSQSDDKEFDLIKDANHYKLFFNEKYHRRIVKWLQHRFN